MGGSPNGRLSKPLAGNTPKLYRIIVNKVNIQAKDLINLAWIFVLYWY